MNNKPSIVEYAPAPTDSRKIPVILWWFAADGALFVGAVCYMMVAFEEAGPYKDLPPSQAGILEIWMFAATALFVFLLGWAARGWWRKRTESGMRE